MVTLNHIFISDQVILDAKAMLIHAVELEGKQLDFYYDNSKIRIDLPERSAKMKHILCISNTQHNLKM